MANKTLKAEKIINTAVSQFQQSYDKVQKANELLTRDIESDRLELIDKQKQIDELKKSMQDVKNDISVKESKIKANNSLAEQLKTFIQEA